jgi:DNA-binding FadR family transcriptional regulator
VVLPRSSWNHLDPDLLALREELAPDLDFVTSLIEARRVVSRPPRPLQPSAPRARIFTDRGCLRRDVQRRTGRCEAYVSADEAFHIAILLASRNPVFATFGGIIGSALRSAFRLTTSVEESHTATLALHGDVLDAIRLRHPDKARDLMERVIDAARTDLARFTASTGRR